ncbi:ABC transporter permease subunit [Brevibacillus sp. 7WMA2]|uniref:ABC transporter permease n=1 Tax=Brevibacillus TaxID=55080 RepID=UPI000EB4CF22|nr:MULTISPECIES: ABC transporter permease subunit [Brevibacillus]AYK08575.1 ABC transporter permease [Brevibacillus laterosporus]MBA4532138.1 ABC transporter permease subunit [Brevibacillus halotolerans]MCR8962832.1 ABC transporter permease [Brevibacillus laterosporus]MCZ0834987.1 ABC transporter permease subunit [Brevibacillus halotolerans]QIC05332.1 ABC transporter permease subunit [Brevibacillus sp. 7WMA2]
MGHFFGNPLISKELRERFRSKRSIWILFSYLMVFGAVLLGYLTIMEKTSTFFLGEGDDLFFAMSALHYALICFIAPALAAGTISGERERQTLNILLTTQLSPRRIILSKLVTSLSFMFLLIMASLPLYSFVFLYGGVSPSQIFSIILFFAINILFFGSLGIFCSTWVKRTGVSTIIAYGIAFFFVVGTGFLLYFLVAIMRYWYPEMNGIENFFLLKWLTYINPCIVGSRILGMTMFSSMSSNDDFYWGYFASFYLVLSIGLLCWSAYLLKPVRRPWSRKQEGMSEGTSE